MNNAKIGYAFLNRIREMYPKEKPVALNYARIRGELLALTARVIHLEETLPDAVGVGQEPLSMALNRFDADRETLIAMLTELQQHGEEAKKALLPACPEEGAAA
jgi:hypothetical protein